MLSLTSLTVIMCDPLSDPANGMVTVSSRMVGSVATYECDAGHVMIGDEARTCQANGQWSGSEPTCECTLLSR